MSPISKGDRVRFAGNWNGVSWMTGDVVDLKTSVLVEGQPSIEFTKVRVRWPINGLTMVHDAKDLIRCEPWISDRDDIEIPVLED